MGALGSAWNGSAWERLGALGSAWERLGARGSASERLGALGSWGAVGCAIPIDSVGPRSWLEVRSA